MKRIKCYAELMTYNTFEERFNYLKLGGLVGRDTFGFDRWLNQVFYKDPEWQKIRQQVIIRDGGCDLGIPDHMIRDRILIHHMNPICKEDILDRNPDILNPEYLITTMHDTHNAIHYGDERYLRRFQVIERRPNDTIPWR